MLFTGGFKNTKNRYNPFRQFCLDSELLSKDLMEKAPKKGALKILMVKTQMVYYFGFLCLFISSWSCLLIFCSLSKALLL